MELLLRRLWLTQRSTCGQLEAESLKLFTLELPVRDGKPGSAIPPGRYPIRLLASPRFMQVGIRDEWVATYATRMPHIVDIPGRSLIMIHWGNFPEETEGCILVGMEHAPDAVVNSRQAFTMLYEKIAACQDEDCWITIEGGAPEADPTPLTSTNISV